VELLGNLDQLLCNGSSLVVVGCLSFSPCNCLIISMNESYRHFFCCQSLAPLVLISSFSFNTCCLGCRLQVMTIATTLIGTLSSLGGLGVVTLELIGLFQHVLHFGLFGTFSRSMFSIRTYNTWMSNMYFNQFNKLCFSFYYKFYRLDYDGWY